MAQKIITRRVKIAGRPFVLRNSDVVRAARNLDPEPIKRHFVVIDGRRFPPKQVMSAVTGLDRANFTSSQARRTLTRLGFVAGRRPPEAATSHARCAGVQSSAKSERLGDRLRSFPGEWIAIKDDDVIHAAKTPRELVEWLRRHGEKADSMFRVPDGELATTGLSPL